MLSLAYLVSIATIPPVVSLVGGGGWRVGWLVRGRIGAACLLGAVPAALRTPELATASGRALWARRVTYGLFGAGYIAYATFIVAFIETQRAGTGLVGVFWATLAAPRSWPPWPGDPPSGACAESSVVLLVVAIVVGFVQRTSHLRRP